MFLQISLPLSGDCRQQQADGDACHGVYIGYDYVHFIGDGSLETYAGWCDRDGLYGEGASVYFCEEVEVTLKGKYGLHQIFNYDTPYVTVEDNAKLTCIGLGTDNADYPALDCAGVEIYNHGELICKTDGWGDAMDTWGSGYAEFPNDYYDILILKKGEFAPGSNWNGEYTEPYKPEKGINVKGQILLSGFQHDAVFGDRDFVPHQFPDAVS